MKPGSRLPALVLAAMILAWATVFAFLSYGKYRYYLYSDIDCALFVQAVDGMLQGSFFSSIRALNWLGDHSSLILFLVAPIYALFRHPATLPAVQSVALALGAIPVYALARRELGGTFVPLAFAALYLLYPALGYTALYEFHPEVLVTGALLAAFACYRADRLVPTVLFAGLALLAKEDVALPVGAFALYTAIARRPHARVYAAALGALAVASLVVSFLILKPLLNPGDVDYGRMYHQWGDSPGGVVRGLLSQPLKAAGSLFVTPEYGFDTVIKLQYYVHMLLPLLFVPLASPLVLAIVLPTLATHFLSWRPAQHTIFYQYTATVTPFFVAAAILGLARLTKPRAAAAGGRSARRQARGEAGDEGGKATPREARSGARGELRTEAREEARKVTRSQAREEARRHRFVKILVLLMLAASLLSNWMFGPLIGHGLLQTVGAEEAVVPTGKDRALARHRDAMMATLGKRDSVVAGFEFLLRLADRRNTRSLHNTLQGLHTFSTRPYPMLDDVTGLIADVSHSRLRPYADQGTSARLHELLGRNRLGLVAAAGDNLLYLRDAPDSVPLWSVGEMPVANPDRVVFDRQLAYLGNEFLSTTTIPGGLLPFRTFWRKVAPTDSLYVLQLTAYDASEKAAFSQWRYLGYMLHPAADWPDTTMVGETYRLVIPDDARPGTYMLGMRVGRRHRLDQVLCETDDPRVRSQSMVVELGLFTIQGRP